MIRPTKILLCSRVLNSRLVWYSNGWKLLKSWIDHLQTVDLNVLSIYPLFRSWWQEPGIWITFISVNGLVRVCNMNIIKSGCCFQLFYPPSSVIALCVRTAGTVTWRLHLMRPCYVALGRVQMWVVCQDWSNKMINCAPRFGGNLMAQIANFYFEIKMRFVRRTWWDFGGKNSKMLIEMFNFRWRLKCSNFNNRNFFSRVPNLLLEIRFDVLHFGGADNKWCNFTLEGSHEHLTMDSWFLLRCGANRT